MHYDLKKIVSTIDRNYGVNFFNSIVQSLAETIQCDYVFIGKLDIENRISKTVAVSAMGNIVDNFQYDLENTPCSNVADDSVCCYPNSVTQYFPKDQLLMEMGIESYLGTPLYDSKGLVMGLVVALHTKPLTNIDEITALFQLFSSQIAGELERNEQDQKLQLFANIMKNTNEAMIICNEENKILTTNKAFEKIFKYTQQDVYLKDPKIFASGIHPKSFYKKLWKSIEENGYWQGELTDIDINGKILYLWSSINKIQTNTNESYYYAIYTDIHEIKKYKDEIKKLSLYDKLTNLYNKSYLQDFLKDNLHYSLIIVDINNFSYINEAYGFNIGDAILKEIAKILQNFNAKLVSSIDADKFALIFEQETDIVLKLKEIQKYFSDNEIMVENIKVYVSFNYGISHYSDNLFRNASMALKQSKELGKNRYVIIDDKYYDNNLEKRVSYIKSNNIIHDAISNNTVIPYFQGIRNNKTGKINKYEALMRIHKDGEILTPAHFLESVKLSGQFQKLTKIMIEKTFEVMKNNTYTFSINITEDDLNDNYLETYLTNQCSKFNIPNERVILEILEGVSNSGKYAHVEQLKKLNSLGFKIAIDDFGAEYSNFERILDLEIDFIKIDAKYIKNIDRDKKSLEIVRAITFFAKNTGIECIAEFVHSQNVQTMIEALDISYSQGYYFSEPRKIIDV